MTVRARWWTHSQQADVVHVRAAVLEAIKEGLDAAGIDMPYDTQVQLFTIKRKRPKAIAASSGKGGRRRR